MIGCAGLQAAGCRLGRAAAAAADRAAFLVVCGRTLLVGFVPALLPRRRRPYLDAIIRELAPPQNRAAAFRPTACLVVARLASPRCAPLGGGDRCREKEPIVSVMVVQGADLARLRHVVTDL